MAQSSAVDKIASQLAKATGVPEEHAAKILSALKFDAFVDRAQAASAVVGNQDYAGLSGWTKEEQKQFELASNPDNLTLDNLRVVVTTGAGSLSRGAGLVA